MVTVLPPVERGPSLGQRLSHGVGRALDRGSQMMEEHKAKQMLSHENDQIKNKFGIDLSGISNPEARKAIISEMLKSKGKQELLSNKQDYLGKLFGGNQPQENSDQSYLNMSDQLSGQGQNSQRSGFDASKLTDQQIALATSVDPNIGRSLQHAKDVALRDKRAQEKYELQKEKQSPEFQRQQHIESSQAQSDVKYNQNLQELSRQHELKEQTLNRLEALNKKGVTGKPYEKLLEKSGLIALTSDGRREFAADVKNLITDIRSILGGQFSQAEFMTILNAYPSADFSKNANTAIIRNLKDFQDIKTKEVDFAEDLKKENGGKIPQDFQAKVNQRVREYVDKKIPEIKENTRKIMNEEYGIQPGFYLMFDPQGEPLQVSPEDIEKYESLGATLP